MVRKEELEGLARKYQQSGEEEKPRVLFVDLPDAKDAIVQVEEGLIIAVTEVEEDICKVALDQAVKKADLIENGKWKVTTVDGSQYVVNLLTGEVKRLGKGRQLPTFC